MTERVKNFVRLQLPAIMWACIIFVLSSIPASKLPDIGLLTFDKLIHITIFFVFGILMYRALGRRTNPAVFDWKRASIAVGSALSYGILDELHQGLVPGRSLDVFDMIADTAGGVLAMLILYALTVRKRRRLSANA